MTVWFKQIKSRESHAAASSYALQWGELMWTISSFLSFFYYFARLTTILNYFIDIIFLRAPCFPLCIYSGLSAHPFLTIYSSFLSTYSSVSFHPFHRPNSFAPFASAHQLFEFNYVNYSFWASIISLIIVFLTRSSLEIPPTISLPKIGF